MIRRMVRAHRPHCALQPRQPYTWPAVRGFAPPTTLRTSLSLNTLQEQTIMEGPGVPTFLVRYATIDTSMTRTGKEVNSAFVRILNRAGSK
jgi:hypothetical protein